MTVFFVRSRMNPFASLTGILMMVLVMIGVFYVAKGVFWLLMKTAVFLLAGAILLHWPTVVGYVRWLLRTWKHSILQGLLATALSVVLYPVVFGFLFLRALLHRLVIRFERHAQREQQAEFVDFEELESSLADKRRKSTSAASDRYADLFE